MSCSARHQEKQRIRAKLKKKESRCRQGGCGIHRKQLYIKGDITNEHGKMQQLMIPITRKGWMLLRIYTFEQAYTSKGVGTSDAKK